MTGPSRSFLVGGLVVSLMLNALLAGLFIGRAAQPSPTPLPALERRAMLTELSREDQRMLRRLFLRARREAAPEIRAHREARRAARLALLAEPYDATAVDAALERERAANTAVAAKIQSALSQEFGRLAPENRDRLAEFALSGREPRGHRGRR